MFMGISFIFRKIGHYLFGVFALFVLLGAMILLYAHANHTNGHALFAEYTANYVDGIGQLIGGLVRLGKAVVVAIMDNI